MTAVDQARNCVLRYRITNYAVDVVVNPARQLIDELVLTTAVSALWLGNHFTQKGGG
jgi:hypothetical protein